MLSLSLPLQLWHNNICISFSIDRRW
jgi:hypothetical protein